MATQPGRADISGTAVSRPFVAVLREELRLIRLRRGGSPAANPGVPDADVVRDAQEVSALGVSFSGGGIRSATFNLGVAQGLAEQDLWPQVDYLSTVSGGGYIGTWLHGVVRSKHDGAANTGGGAATTPSAAVFRVESDAADRPR